MTNILLKIPSSAMHKSNCLSNDLRNSVNRAFNTCLGRCKWSDLNFIITPDQYSKFIIDLSNGGHNTVPIWATEIKYMKEALPAPIDCRSGNGRGQPAVQFKLEIPNYQNSHNTAMAGLLYDVFQLDTSEMFGPILILCTPNHFAEFIIKRNDTPGLDNWVKALEAEYVDKKIIETSTIDCTGKEPVWS